MLSFPFVILEFDSVEMLQCFVTSSDRNKISRNWECDVCFLQTAISDFIIEQSCVHI